MNFLQAEGMAGSSSGLSSSPSHHLCSCCCDQSSKTLFGRYCEVLHSTPSLPWDSGLYPEQTLSQQLRLPGSLLKVTLSPRWSFLCLVAPAASLALQLRFLVSLPQTSTRIRLLYPTPRCFFSVSKDQLLLPFFLETRLKCLCPNPSS